MKNKISLPALTICAFFICGFININAQTSETYKEIKGHIIDEETKSPLVFSDLVIADSNISTVTNNDGEFLLKIPKEFYNSTLIISHLGYKKKNVEISTLKNKVKITLTASIIELNTINISGIDSNPSISAKTLVKRTLKKKSSIYNNSNTLMTAFYREAIKKRRKNASLSEAVVKIHKQPYSSFKKDHIELVKARKNTDYSKLDTLALKLQGGPFSNLYTDLVKYPEYIFTEKDIDLYSFSFGKATNIDNKLIYVVNFKQNEGISTPMYHGQLYIDAKSLALTSAVYSLNVENKELSSQMFVRKKPRKVDVYPTKATYRVNYRTKDDKWQYSYSNILLTFKVNWKGKLFNSTYTLNSEMAITDWEIQQTKIAKMRNLMLKPSTILTDQASGFSDPKFWGEYNIIEPEKSIESAIKKIKKQLKKT